MGEFVGPAAACVERARLRIEFASESVAAGQTHSAGFRAASAWPAWADADAAHPEARSARHPAVSRQAAACWPVSNGRSDKAEAGSVEAADRKHWEEAGAADRGGEPASEVRFGRKRGGKHRLPAEDSHSGVKGGFATGAVLPADAETGRTAERDTRPEGGNEVIFLIPWCLCE